MRLSLPLVLFALLGCPPAEKVPGVGDDSTSTDPCADGTGNCDEDGDGFSVSAGDCDDNDAHVNPGAEEACNGLDDDCDGAADEDALVTFYQDFDRDGFGNPEVSDDACEPPSGYITNGADCDDQDGAAFPGAEEVCDGADNDCDGDVDENVADTWYVDADADGFGDPGTAMLACSQPTGYVADGTDCNDATSRARPDGTEVCDEIDNDCDGVVDDGVTSTWYVDADGDGYGYADLAQDACSAPTGYAGNAADCDDGLAQVNPSATELCNLLDDDCDGATDEDDAADATTWYVDADADGYGSSAASRTSCVAPSGYAAADTDCDDARALTNPGATEYCNTYDDDCDGATDEDDAADAPTWYVDADADGYGSSSVTDVSCTAPSGFVATGTDCVDTSAVSHPGADEICDELDNDCDGVVDDDPVDGETYYLDADADGFGDPASTDSECALPSGYAENAYDCDDADGSEPRVADAASGSPSGAGTLASPYDTIQDAVGGADLCVVVYPGTYTEQLDMDGKSIDVWGVEGADYTTIDANVSTCTAADPTACAPAVTIASGSNASPTLHGFTITGGSGRVSSTTSTTTCADSSASHTGRNTCAVTTYSYCGGGVYVKGDDPSFYDVIVRDNTLPAFEQVAMGTFEQYWFYSYGGGVCVEDASVSFEDSIVEGNFADQGGGFYVGSLGSLVFEQGTLAENDAADGAGLAVAAGSAALTNAVVACNDATTDGGGLFTETSGTSTFTNVVMFGNTSSTTGSTRGAEAYVGASTQFDLYNAIVESNIATYAIYGAGGTGTHSYDNVYNAAGSTYGGTLSAGAGAIGSGGNFTSASCDGNPYNDDYTLIAGTASVDAGDPSVLDADGSRSDMGAFGGPGGSW